MVANMSDSRSGEVSRYAHKRYRSFFQRIVDNREQRLVRQMLAAAELPESGAHVVDIPCGYGRFYQLFKSRGWRVTALDRSQGMVDFMHERDDMEPSDRGRLARADIGDPFVPGGADLAVCIRLLQHMPEAETRRRALTNLAAAGQGRVLITYYDRFCLHYWTKKLAARLTGKPARIHMISRAAMTADLVSADLRVKRLRRLMPGIHAQTWVLLEAGAKPVRAVQLLFCSLVGNTLVQFAEQLAPIV